MNIKTINDIINHDYIIKAYTTPDNHFLKVENKNGAVYTIWQKHDGYQMTSPIEPNRITGSSTMVLGEGEFDYGDIESVIKIIENGVICCPSFFNETDRKATKFLNIEKAVAVHSNILKFNKIK